MKYENDPLLPLL
jgi:hypothetical protein